MTSNLDQNDGDNMQKGLLRLARELGKLLGQEFYRKARDAECGSPDLPDPDDAVTPDNQSS